MARASAGFLTWDLGWEMRWVQEAFLEVVFESSQESYAGTDSVKL